MNLNEILRNVDILQLFKGDLFSTITAPEIEKQLGLSHHPTFRRLKILEKNNVLLKSDRSYSLNIQNKTVFEIVKFLNNIEKIKEEDKR